MPTEKEESGVEGPQEEKEDIPMGEVDLGEQLEKLGEEGGVPGSLAAIHDRGLEGDEADELVSDLVDIAKEEEEGEREAAAARSIAEIARNGDETAKQSLLDLWKSEEISNILTRKQLHDGLEDTVDNEEDVHEMIRVAEEKEEPLLIRAANQIGIRFSTRRIADENTSKEDILHELDKFGEGQLFSGEKDPYLPHSETKLIEEEDVENMLTALEHENKKVRDRAKEVITQLMK